MIDPLGHETTRGSDRLLLELASTIGHIGGWSVDLATNRVTWSDEVARIHGMPPGTSPTVEEGIDFYAPEHRARIQNVFSACALDGTPFDEELTILRVDGQRAWVRAIGRAVRDASGTIVTVHGAFQDITDRKVAQASLTQSERRFRELAESMPVIVWTADPDGTVDYANRIFAEYTGVSTDEPLDELWPQTLHPEDLGRTVQTWGDSIASGLPYEIQFRIRRGQDGAYRWHLTRAVPIHDDQGALTKWYGSAIDIHDQVELLEESRRLSARLNTTLESIGDGLLTLDRSWRVTYMNSQAERLAHRSSADLLGRVIWDEFPEAVGSRFQEEYERAVSTGETRTFEEYFPPLERWFDVSAYPATDGLAIYFRDVTERHAKDLALREADERFRLLSQATSDAIWDWDLRANAVWRSDGFEALFGIRPGELRPTSPEWIDRLHPDDRQRVLDGIEAAISGDASEWEAEYQFQREGGTYARVLDRASIIRDDAGNAIRVVGGMTDVSTERALEAQLRQAQRLDSIGQLTGGIAHDFNNLLTVILGYSELLVDELRGEPARKELAETTMRAARRGAELTSQLLAFARRQPLEPRAVDVGALLAGMDDLLRRTLGETIEVDIVHAGDRWSALVDPAQLESALLNLAINARDAMVPAGGRLAIETAEVRLGAEDASDVAGDAGERYVMIAVSDTGIGIPASDLDRVFDPFFTTKATGQGTGLGLSMVFGFVKQSGGHIRIFSEPGQGTTVRMYLPRAAEPSAPPAAQEEIEPTGGGNEAILLVEDDDLVRRYAQEQLIALGYQVTTAPDGPTAIAVVQERSDLDLLFTDVIMPGGMNGRQLADAAREIHPDLCVLFTSGYSESAIEHDGRLDPDVHLLRKPYGRSDLARAIRGALDSQG